MSLGAGEMAEFGGEEEHSVVCRGLVAYEECVEKSRRMSDQNEVW